MNDLAIQGCVAEKPLDGTVRASIGRIFILLSLAILPPLFLHTAAKGESSHPAPEAEKADSLKTPQGAALRSFLVPGWGQWYNERKIKSAGIFVAESVVIALAIRESRRFDRYGDEKAHKQRNTLYWWTFFLHAAAVMDAYVDASLLRFNENMDISMDETDHTWAMTFSYSW